MTTTKPRHKPVNPKSLWRREPHCDTKRAEMSYAMYERKGQQIKEKKR